MKTMILLLLASSVWAVQCEKGCSEWEGVCACDAPKASSSEPEQNYASDEKPSKHPEPAYQRGEVNIVNVPNTAEEDIKIDQEKAKADAEGRKAAGLK